ncbi:hypothetical protein JTB14_027178 [Gonioctena quinquepunctata]|nr:hypothetical protein JTB14_027178 [Gonioctena quinquepunctata]
MQSNNNSVFKCCKKASTYSTCIKCSGIFHKTCLNRAKKNYKFLANNHVICCAEEQAQEATEEISTLEITIQDLTEDTVLKSKHIQKLKSENDKFAQKAIKVETELNDIIDQQKKYIEELVIQIQELQKKTSEKEYVMKNTGTQTCSHRDQVPSMNEKSLASGVAGKKAAAVNKNELKPMDIPDPYANYVKRAWITQMRRRLLPFYPEIPPDDFRRTPREALEFLQEYENDQPQLNYPPESLENNALTLEEMKKMYPLIKFFNDMHLTPRKIQKLLSSENNLRLMELLDNFDNIRSEDEAQELLRKHLNERLELENKPNVKFTESYTPDNFRTTYDFSNDHDFHETRVYYDENDEDNSEYGSGHPIDEIFRERNNGEGIFRERHNGEDDFRERHNDEGIFGDRKSHEDDNVPAGRGIFGKLNQGSKVDIPDPYANYVERAWITQMRCRLLPFYPEIPPDDFRRTNPREALEFLQEYENDQPQLNYPPESLENNALTLEEMKKIYPLIKFFNDMHLTPRKIQKLLSPENNLRLMELLDNFDIRSEDEAQELLRKHLNERLELENKPNVTFTESYTPDNFRTTWDS